MASRQGWVKLHRDLLDWEWYEDKEVTRLFLHVLLKANYEEKAWRGRIIKRGQMLTSIDKLAAQTGLSIQQTRTALSKLKKTSTITSKTTNKNTLLTIENYEIYQVRGESATSETTNEQQVNQQTNNKQPRTEITTTKEVKKKEVKNNYLFAQFWEEYPVRKRKNKGTAERAWKKINPGEQLAAEIISAVQRAKTSRDWIKDDGEYIPHPGTWLNAKGWEDVIVEFSSDYEGSTKTSLRTIHQQLTDTSWAN